MKQAIEKMGEDGRQKARLQSTSDQKYPIEHQAIPESSLGTVSLNALVEEDSNPLALHTNYALFSCSNSALLDFVCILGLEL